MTKHPMTREHSCLVNAWDDDRTCLTLAVKSEVDISVFPDLGYDDRTWVADASLPRHLEAEDEIGDLDPRPIGNVFTVEICVSGKEDRICSFEFRPR